MTKNKKIIDEEKKPSLKKCKVATPKIDVKTLKIGIKHVKNSKKRQKIHD